MTSSRTNPSRRLARASPIHAAPPGTARASTSRCSPSTPSRSSCASSTQRATRTPAHHAARAHRPRLARLPARGAPRPALRLPRARPVQARARPSLQPAQAAARSVRDATSSASCAGTTRSTATPSATRRRDLSFDRRDSAAYMPKCRVLDPAFTWGDDRRPDVPWHDTVIYELHVRGFTHAPSGRAASRCAAPTPAWPPRRSIDHLQAPRRHHGRADAGARLHRRPPPASNKGLRNYWGYNTLGFFAPEPRYCCRRARSSEFKTMVQDAALGRHRGDPRRGLQPHRRGQPARARRCRFAASTTPPTTGSSRRPALLRRLHRLRQHAQPASTRACCSW